VRLKWEGEIRNGWKTDDKDGRMKDSSGGEQGRLDL
jgi:hypothetical protein